MATIFMRRCDLYEQPRTSFLLGGRQSVSLAGYETIEVY